MWTRRLQSYDWENAADMGSKSSTMVCLPSILHLEEHTDLQRSCYRDLALCLIVSESIEEELPPIFTTGWKDLLMPLASV